MAPADLLLPLEGQRDDTLRLIDSLSEDDLERRVQGDWTVRQLLCHLVDREYGVAFAIRRALDGEVVHLSPGEREQILEAEHGPVAAGWRLDRIRSELVEARQALRAAFEAMDEDDLDLPIRWPDWPARTIRTSIPYVLEHEDSHLDDLRASLQH